MSTPSRHTQPYVLRLGPPAGTAPDALASVLEKARLPVIALPIDPPASPEAFRQLIRQVGFALLDLDQNAPALRWLHALRTHRPGLPIVAVFRNSDLPELLPAGVGGLDGALQLPASPDKITAVLQAWLPVAPTVAPARPDSFFGAPSPPPRAVRHRATHLSPASEANQQLLQALAEQPSATRFLARGPAGAEFTLLALELAARLQIADADIAFSDGPVAPICRLLITRDPHLFRHTLAPFAVCVREVGPSAANAIEASPATSAPPVVLELKPLRRRLADVAHYTARHLPSLAASSLQAVPCLPLPPAWRHALLSHLWPGEFAELWQTLQRLALLRPGDAPPFDLGAPAGPGHTFEDLVRLSAPRAYRERLGQRIPVSLLPSVLGALGCPDHP